MQFALGRRGEQSLGAPVLRLRAAEPAAGFWWLYVPLQFESYSLIVILQEEPDGYRTVNDAKRIWKDGRVEQLGWPRVDISYRAGTRHPQAARIHLADRAGRPLAVDVETVTSVPLHVGAGYSGDPDRSHGQWMGRHWSRSSVYDRTDPAVAGRVPFGVTDHLARAGQARHHGQQPRLGARCQAAAGRGSHARAGADRSRASARSRCSGPSC